MKNYEIMYILAPTLDEAGTKSAVESLHKILTGNGAKITGVKEWGMRDLAYPIKKQTKGYYAIVNFEAEPVAVNEFDRIVKLDTRVLRFLVTVC